jgi:hypothetical protein
VQERGFFFFSLQITQDNPLGTFHRFRELCVRTWTKIKYLFPTIAPQKWWQNGEAQVADGVRSRIRCWRDLEWGRRDGGVGSEGGGQGEFLSLLLTLLGGWGDM